MLLTLRRMPMIDGSDLARCHDILKAIIGDYPMINTIGVVDSDGSIGCHNLITSRRAFGDPELAAADPGVRRAALQCRHVPLGLISGKQTVITASPLPHRDGEAPKGVVFASLKLEAFQHSVGDLVGSKGRTVRVIDPRTGTLVSGTQDHLGLIGRSFGGTPLVRAIAAEPEGGVIETSDSPGSRGSSPSCHCPGSAPERRS